MCKDCIICIFPFSLISDEDFKSNMFTADSTISLQNFNTIRLELLKDNLNALDDIDPDLHCDIFKNSECNYYIPQEFVSKYVTREEYFFSTIHFNARSLSKNFNDISDFLSAINYPFSIIAFTETWLQEHTPHCFDFSGYNFVYSNRIQKKGGGVAMLVRDCFEFKTRDDLKMCNDKIESIFIEINISERKNIIVGTIYRPPASNIHCFLEEIEALLIKISKDKNG